MHNLLSTIQYFLLITAELTLLFLGNGTIVALVLFLLLPSFHAWELSFSIRCATNSATAPVMLVH